jgi:hypothetical protein
MLEWKIIWRVGGCGLVVKVISHLSAVAGFFGAGSARFKIDVKKLL